ncbi:hypothetical protein [Aquimarina sp. I32.4]|nr:hypothetical protein [Aquimarina sp. I32.4]
MKNQVLNQYKPLLQKEMILINGGCGGEDISCPISQVLEALKYIRIM